MHRAAGAALQIGVAAAALQIGVAGIAASGSGVDEHSLRLLEFHRVIAAVAEQTCCEAARIAAASARPIADASERRAECARLAESVRRVAEPADWCFTGRGSLSERLGDDRTGNPEPDEPLDGQALVDVRTWLEAAAATRESWRDDDPRTRFPMLAAVSDSIPDLAPLRDRLAAALEDDGTLRDSASPALKRLRSELATGERRLEQQLARWAAPFGENAYVTRHGDRFVALVPAAGFPRRRGIVHDVSNTGQSLFVEPLEACEANNRLLEIRNAALDEERRILRELAGAVLDAAAELGALEGAIVHLDTLRARGRWANAHRAVAVTPGGDGLSLRDARHPLLAMAERAGGARVVPFDLGLGDGGRVLIVSGPNMGGKTVLLKTVGLTVALAHAGFPVTAAEGSVVPEITEIVVDLGDEQSLDQGLSSFAAHLRVLARMAEQAGPGTLVLCDELGAGTDPEEGGALARALIEHVAGRGAWGVMTTHLGSLKRVAGEVDHVVNGSLEFDAETLTSRFRFLPGVPGASHALSVADRLGFPRPLLDRARALTPGETLALEKLIADLNEVTARTAEARVAADAARAEAERAAAEHRAATEEARTGLAEQRRRVTREGEALLARARELWQTVQREARREEKHRAGAAKLGEEIRDLERAHGDLAGPPEREAVVPPPVIAAGQRVRVVDLGVEAEVVSGPDADGKVRLRRGSWAIESHASRLAAVATPATATEPRRPVTGTWEASDEAPPLEVDLRGMEADEATSALDQALDRAVRAGLAELRVIHGIGRGVLRAAVERHLRGHPQVAGQRLGQVGEGGRGVTVARLR
jgi:DNA mismatch repair protein MutS2